MFAAGKSTWRLDKDAFLLQLITRRRFGLAVPTQGSTGDSAADDTKRRSKPVYGKRKPVKKQADAPPPVPAALVVEKPDDHGGKDEGKDPPGPADDEEEEDEAVEAPAPADRSVAVEAAPGAVDDWEDAVDDWDTVDVSVRRSPMALGRGLRVKAALEFTVLRGLDVCGVWSVVEVPCAEILEEGGA